MPDVGRDRKARYKPRHLAPTPLWWRISLVTWLSLVTIWLGNFTVQAVFFNDCDEACEFFICARSHYTRDCLEPTSGAKR